MCDGAPHPLAAAEEQLRGTLALPHGLGKDVTVAVFAEGQQARDAEAAGADFVGGQDLAEKVQEGWTDFDVVISTPDMMKTVGQLGRVLGPQGKMPNPKVGTVTDDIEKAVSESKAGKVEYRTDRQAIVHLAIGKASFDEQKLLRVFHNLARNAVEAMPTGGKLRVQVDKVGEQIQWTVSDNGPGIPPELRGRLFELFATGKKGGTGLGLAIVKKIIDDHHGTIAVESLGTSRMPLAPAAINCSMACTSLSLSPSNLPA